MLYFSGYIWYIYFFNCNWKDDFLCVIPVIIKTLCLCLLSISLFTHHQRKRKEIRLCLPATWDASWPSQCPLQAYRSWTFAWQHVWSLFFYFIHFFFFSRALQVPAVDYSFEDCQLSMVKGPLCLPSHTSLLEFSRLVRKLGWVMPETSEYCARRWRFSGFHEQHSVLCRARGNWMNPQAWDLSVQAGPEPKPVHSSKYGTQ